ncbi:MAG: hypothetical protein ACMG6E_08455 [Candidatus Roizmanbacteria bacterium]
MRFEYLGEKELSEKEKKIIERLNKLKDKMSKTRAAMSEKREQDNIINELGESS